MFFVEFQNKQFSCSFLVGRGRVKNPVQRRGVGRILELSSLKIIVTITSTDSTDLILRVKLCTFVVVVIFLPLVTPLIGARYFAMPCRDFSNSSDKRSKKL